MGYFVLRKLVGKMHELVPKKETGKESLPPMKFFIPHSIRNQVPDKEPESKPEKIEEPINRTIGELIKRTREKAKEDKGWIEVSADLMRAGAKSWELEEKD